MNRAKSFLVGLAALSLALVSVAHGIRSYNLLFFLMPVMLPLLVLGVSRLDWVLVMAIALMNSKLVLPGLPGELELYHLLLVFLGGVMVFRRMITKERLVQDPVLRFAAVFYAFVAFYTLLARGIGFRVLGDGQAGGMRYVMIFIGAFVVCLVPNIHISRVHLKKALVVSSFLSFLPVLAEGVLLATGGRFYWQYNFLQPGFGLGMSLDAVLTGKGVRFMSASILGRGLVYLPFFLFPMERRYRSPYALMILLGLGIGGFSGFRSVLIYTVVFLFLVGFLLSAGKRRAYTMVWLGGGLIAYILLFLVFRFLPFGIQRSLAFVPFLPVDTEVMWDARSTIDYRLGVWELAVKEIPDRLLLGRGLAFDMNELAAVESAHWMSDKLSVAGLIANLHNGPLELIVYMGLPGVLFFCIFMGRAGVVAVRAVQRGHREEEGRRLLAFFSAHVLAAGILFLASFGNPYATFMNMCVQLALIRIIGREMIRDTHGQPPA